MPTTQMIPVTWVRSEHEIDAFRQEVVHEGGQIHGEPEAFQPPPGEEGDYRDANFDPLTVLATTVSVSFLLTTLSSIWLEHRHTGGLIVDARAGRLEVRPSVNLERGKVFMLTDDGVQKWDADKKNEALDSLRLLVNKSLNG